MKKYRIYYMDKREELVSEEIEASGVRESTNSVVFFRGKNKRVFPKKDFIKYLSIIY